MKKLIEIQKSLKAPKNQYNSFGNFKYRSCEDILEAVKPLCAEKDCLLVLSDEVVKKGEHLFVEATATFTDGDYSIEVKAQAKHPLAKEGMDDSQITGASSSYARKYALNGLFCIDDSKDSDATNQGTTPKRKLTKMSKNKVSDAIKFIKGGRTMEELKGYYEISPEIEKEIAKGLL